MFCKNCKYFDKDDKESEELGFSVGGCDAQARDVSHMKNNECAIICGHDGGVWVAENFSCIHFEPKL